MRKNANRPDVENPEWTSDEMARAKPLMDLLPKETAEAFRRYRGQRGPQKSPTKELISLRVDRDVVAAYRATGAGWQTRASEVLRAHIKKSGFADRTSGARRCATRTRMNARRRAQSR